MVAQIVEGRQGTTRMRHRIAESFGRQIAQEHRYTLVCSVDFAEHPVKSVDVGTPAQSRIGWTSIAHDLPIVGTRGFAQHQHIHLAHFFGTCRCRMIAEHI